VSETRQGKEAPARKRWEALDDLRGLAVLIMIPVNVAAPYAGIPAWFKHAPADGLTIADVVVPLFLFSLGMSAGFSWKRRVAERGYGRTLLHAVIRNALLCAFGVAGMLLADPGDRWEVLTMLGVTGMLSFFFLGLRPLPRIAAGLLLLAVVELLRPLGLGLLMGRWYDTGLAGPWGTASLAFFPIVASALGELAVEQPPARKVTILGAAGFLMAAAGAGALVYAPFSKHLLSVSYILFTAGLSSGILALLAIGREMAHVRLPFLDAMGRNPLLLYMLHSVLGLAALALFAAMSPGWIAWISAGGVLVICVLAALLLDWRKLYVKL
jgi:predicted acyltransferase